MLTPSVDQVARDQWLLDTARDYFHFVTEFFEVINISATHIYHSALELSPMSSIVRKLYHRRRLAPSPRVLIGVPDSWDKYISIRIPHKVDSHQVPFAWSPCGQFIATREQEVVKIRDPFTFEILSTLLPAEYPPRQCHLLHGPAYSPDGHSIACLSNIGIRIWDTQTGGVTKEIECGCDTAHSASLLWSLDGRNIVAAHSDPTGKAWVVRTFDVTSGTRLSAGTLPKVGDPSIWAHDTSFRIMAAVRTEDIDELDTCCVVAVFEVGSPLAKTESLSCHIRLRGKQANIRFGSFSPTTHRISISPPGRLLILSIQNSECLLEETGVFHVHTHYFSPDGSLFASSSLFSSLHIWKYSFDHYIPWRKLHEQDPQVGAGLLSFRFSPASSWILCLRGGLLRACRSDDPDDPPATVATNAHDLATVSRSGAYVITAHTGGNAVTITNLLTQIPSQIIDTGAEVRVMAISGDILLTAGRTKIKAWPLTEEGVVDGVFDGRMASDSDSIWTVSPADTHKQAPPVCGHTSAIELGKNAYYTGTGEALALEGCPQRAGRWYGLRETLWGHRRESCEECDPPEGDRPAPRTIFRDGWVKNLEGEHRLWVPTKWGMNRPADSPSDPGFQPTLIVMF